MFYLRSSCLLALAFLLAATPFTFAQGSAAAAYTIIDHSTGHVLESSGAQKKLQVASLTKVATAMVVLDWAEARGQDLGQLATVPPSVANISSIQGAVDLQPGDQAALKDLIYAALLQSDNKAAQTLAEHVGRTLGEGEATTLFVQQMNALARKVGMPNTRFLNPHGLDETERRPPYSTAQDLGELTRYAMERPSFRFYVSQRERRINVVSAGASQGFLLRNTNELLGVDKIDGVKTGTTRKAGQCLILSVAKEPESRQEGEKHFITPRRLDVVILGAADRFGLGRSLVARGWQLHESWVAAGRPQEAEKPAKRGREKRNVQPFNG